MSTGILDLVRQRKAASLTQKELAELLEVSTSAVGMWEAGERKPDIIMLKKIATLLGCTTDELLSTIDV